MEELLPLNGNCFKKLVQIGLGHSIQYPIIYLKAINTSPDAFVAMLSNPKKLMEGQFEKLELDGRPVQVVPYPTVAKVSEIEDSVEAFEYSYDPNESTKSQLQKIPAISNFIQIANHCRITKYILEYCLCGKQGCIVCAKIGRCVITPGISIKGNNI